MNRPRRIEAIPGPGVTKNTNPTRMTSVPVAPTRTRQGRRRAGCTCIRRRKSLKRARALLHRRVRSRPTGVAPEAGGPFCGLSDMHSQYSVETTGVGVGRRGSLVLPDCRRSSEGDQWPSTRTESRVFTRNGGGGGRWALGRVMSPVDIAKRPHGRADSIGKKHARPLATGVGRTVSVHIPRTSRSHRVRRA